MKAEDNQFPHVTLAEQSSAPATPAAGLGLMYEKADGKLYFLNDGGVEVRLGALTVQDENANVSTAVTQIDFQGAGVSVSPGTGEVVVTIPGGGGSGGSSAAYLCPPAEGTTSAAYTTTSSTDADVDAAVLKVTFTVPASGIVEVIQDGYAGWGSTSGGFEWTVREGATVISTVSAGGAAVLNDRKFIVHRLTGLTPGASKTYTWGFHRVGATGTHTLYTGGSSSVNGNARMSVRDGGNL